MTSQVTTQVPVLLSEDYNHVMATAEVITSDVHELVEVRLHMTATGEQAKDLVALFTSGEPQGLKFVAIPVTPPSKQKEHHE